MLYRSGEERIAKRIQGIDISAKESERAADFVKKKFTSPPLYADTVFANIFDARQEED